MNTSWLLTQDQLGLAAGPWHLVMKAALGHLSALQGSFIVYLIEMARPLLSHVAR